MHNITEHRFRTFDGAELFYRAWLPQHWNGNSVLLFHRGHEHSARWAETVQTLQLHDTAFFAWDQRGHGLSSGKRGHAPDLSAVIKDVDCFARHLVETHHVTLDRTALVAASFGAVIAAAWIHDYGPPIRGMVLAAPALELKLYVPLALPMLRAREKLRPGGIVKSYVTANLITRDPEQVKAYNADPMIFRQIAVNMILDLKDLAYRLLADAAVITTPTLLLAAQRDWVVKLEPQKQFFQRLGSPVKRMEVLPDFGHAIFHEKDRRLAVDKVRNFLQESFDRPCACDALLHADKGGATRTEYDLLSTPAGLKWKLARANMKTFGRLSKGVSLGWRAGFDSGVMLDYVYQNRPRGFPLLGHAIDYFFLNAIGWRGIRIRRDNLQAILLRAVDLLQQHNRDVRILDIAAGPGRYVLETMHRLNGKIASATLRDYMQNNLDAARNLATQLNLHNVNLEKADAFDRNALAAVTPKPTIAIASGLYELFPENAPVQQSLAGIHHALEPAGLLIYTCQPWHPQVELIARTLTNREGKPWIMRRRSQAEMDALVQHAGFQKIDQTIDKWGIFTVSLARKLPR